MVKYVMTTVLVCFFSGCASNAVQNSPTTKPMNKPGGTESAHQTSACLGTVTIAPQFADHFSSIEDESLLNQALGEPNAGKLCQGRVYQSKADSHVVIYRAWNSTNPNSEKGQWWAFYKPKGLVSQYRSDYEICYQWSPLDKMVRCRLNAGAKVVIGTGQSAECSPYLRYSKSAKQQIYIDNASASVSDCTTYDGAFRWKRE